MEIIISKVEKRDELYCRYPAESGPQDCFIELDPATGRVYADYNSELGNEQTADVFNSVVYRYQIPALKAEAVNNVMDKLVPLFSRVCDGWECDAYDGGKLDDDGGEADDAIEEALGMWSSHSSLFDDTDKVCVHDADDWFVEGLPEAEVQMLKDGKRAELVELVQNECDNVVDGFIENLDEYLDAVEEEIKDPESVNYSRIQ